MQVESDFRELVQHLEREGAVNLQLFLKHAELEDVPERFRGAYSFWKTLSGRSRNLMLDGAQGRRVNKRF